MSIEHNIEAKKNKNLLQPFALSTEEKKLLNNMDGRRTYAPEPQEMSLDNDIFTFQQEEKEIPPMDTTLLVPPAQHMKKPLDPPQRRQAEDPAAAALKEQWDDRYIDAEEDNLKYRLVPSVELGGELKPIFAVGEDEETWALLSDEEVEFAFGADMLEDLTEAKLAELWKGKFANLPNGFVPQEPDIINLRMQLLDETLPGADRQLYNDSLKSGGETGATLQLLKSHNAIERYRLLALTQQYYQYNKFKEENLLKGVEGVAREKFTGRAALPDKQHDYEKQPYASNNCFGCAGAKVINHLLGKKVLNQYSIRNYEPRYLSHGENQRLLGAGDIDDYYETRTGVENYAGKNKAHYGNFFGSCDVVFDRSKNGGLGRTDIAVHRAVYMLRDLKNKTVRGNVIEAMKSKLSDMISTGHPVALLTHGHYVTITKIDGDTISYLDSTKSPANKEVSENFTAYLNGDYGFLDTVELNWATKLEPNARGALQDEFNGLGFDPETNEAVRTNGIRSEEDVAHRAGIVITKSRDELIRDGNADIARYMSESICIHRGAFMNEQQLKEWKQRDEKAWNRAKKGLLPEAGGNNIPITVKTEKPKIQPVLIRKEEAKEQPGEKPVIIGKEQEKEKNVITGIEKEQEKEEPVIIEKEKEQEKQAGTEEKKEREQEQEKEAEKPAELDYSDPMALATRSMEVKQAATFRDQSLHERMKLSLSGQKLPENHQYNEELALCAMKTALRNGDDDAAAAELYRILAGGVPKQKDTAKQAEYAVACERVFHAILTYDISRIRPEALTDFFKKSDDYTAITDLSALGRTASALLGNYFALPIAEEQKALSMNHIKELIDRCALLDAVQPLMEAQLKQLLPKAKRADNYDSNIKTVKQLCTKLSREDAQKESRQAAEAIEYNALLKETAKLDTASRVVSNFRSLPECKVKSPASKYFTVFSDTFKPKTSLTVTKREEEMKKPGSELYEKKRIAKLLTDNSNLAKDNAARRRRAISFNIRSGLSDDTFKALSAFFTDDLEENTSLIRHFSGKGDCFNAAITDIEKLRDKTFAFDRITTQFLSLSANGIDLSTDEAIAQNAARIEALTLKVHAIKKLIAEDPAFQKHLQETPCIGGDSLYELVDEQMNRLGLLTDHYRARKLLMTDPLYLLSHNSELSRFAGKDSSAEQKAFAAILNQCLETAGVSTDIRLYRRSAMSWAKETRSAQIDELERQHKSRAFVTGRLDLSLASKDAMVSLGKEMMAFREEFEGISIKNSYKALDKKLTHYSPEFRKLIYFLGETRDLNGNLKPFTDKLNPGLREKLDALMEKPGDANKIKDFRDHADFTDPETGDKIQYGSQLSRDSAHFANVCAEQMMSPEEVIELWESLQAGNRKDIDLTDPAQAAAAKELYLKSMAQVHELFFTFGEKLDKTYGLLPQQLPPMMMLLATGMKQEIAFRYSATNVINDLITHGGAKTGKNIIPTADYLVQQKRLTKDYVAKGKDIDTLQGGMNFATFGMVDMYIGHLESGDPHMQKMLFYEPLPAGGEYDKNNAFRGKTGGPQLNDKEEEQAWILHSAATTLAEMPRQGKMQEQANLNARLKKQNYTRSMLELEGFIEQLKSVDTSRHSKKYKTFEQSFRVLRLMLSQIAAKSVADGRNLDPKSMIALRKAYNTVIKNSADYLSKKNRDHSNLLYRRRYDIVEELKNMLQRDYEILGEKNLDVSHSLEEALEVSRTASLTVSTDDIKILAGQMSHRNLFTVKTNGEERKVIFTERSAVIKGKSEGTYKNAGIPVAANLDKRNVAMSIVAKEIGTEQIIAHSELANVDIIDSKTKTVKNRDNRGIITDFIEGLSGDEVQAAYEAGELLLDNEAEILEQLSDLQVTDYLCGNVDRHMNNVKFVLEETDQMKDGKPLKRIKRVVGIDNDMSFGILKPENMKAHHNKMSIPETIQFISEKLANKILQLDKDQLFVKLGSTVTEDEKEAMWLRVKHMQLAIMNTSSKDKKGVLHVLKEGGFASYNLRDIAGANLEYLNLYNMVARRLHGFGHDKDASEKEDVPHRLNVEEVRLDINVKDTKSTDIGDKEYAVFEGLELANNHLALNPYHLEEGLSDPEFVENYFAYLLGASREFNETVGCLFDSVSTLKNYGKNAPINERADLFTNTYSQSHGINSILDIFFVDGIPARRYVELLTPTVNAILRNPKLKRAALGIPKGEPLPKNVPPEDINALGDMVVKAWLMAIISKGDSQVTIANYQRSKDGKDELAITDLNVLIRGYRKNKIPLFKYNKSAPDAEEKSIIQKSRKNRKTRFAEIKKYMESRKAQAEQRNQQGNNA